jgi:uncharacterized membrane protein
VKTDPLFLRLNLLVLLVVVFLPFPTHLVAAALDSATDERVFVTLYGLTLLTIRLLGSALDAYARHAGLYATHDADQELHNSRRKLLPVVVGDVIAILLGIAVPLVAVALYFGIALYIFIPFRETAEVLIRRRRSRQEGSP